MNRLHRARGLAVGLGLLAVMTVGAACGGDDAPATTPTATEATAAPTEAGTAATTPAATPAATEAATPAVDPGTVAVVLVDFSVRATPASAPAGTVTFATRNGGTVPHELVVIRSDSEPGALPIVDGFVDEAAVDVRGEVAEMPDGGEGSVALELESGRYLLICNVVGHYAAGMVAVVTVE
ncbi:MAG: hypothetical protein O2798_06465 [Chloroflexi bacterium]|nr:hypothetical protein [Chloroflexota bacterium]MDA1240474.1 hypothetical protein [Chloroflexota bacterium]